MNDTIIQLQQLAARLDAHLTLTYGDLEAIYTTYRALVDEAGFQAADLAAIERNLRRMHARSSLLKKDIAFLLARNALAGQIHSILEKNQNNATNARSWIHPQLQ